MPDTKELTTEEFARWLLERAPDRLWSVDGEDEIEQSRSLPCTGEELATELRKRPRRLRFLGPGESSAKPARDLGALSSVAYVDGDEIEFRATWADDPQHLVWLILTDVLAEAANREAQAS